MKGHRSYNSNRTSIIADADDEMIEYKPRRSQYAVFGERWGFERVKKMKARKGMRCLNFKVGLDASECVCESEVDLNKEKNAWFDIFWSMVEVAGDIVYWT